VLDADPAHADVAPVRVRVIEAPSQKFTAGIGFSTDTLYRGQLSYDDFNLDGNGLQLHTDIRAEAKLQNATLRFILPPRVPEYTDSWGASLEHTDISGLAMEDVLFGWKRRTANERDQQTYAATYYVSKQEPLNADSQRAHALYFEYGRAWRRVDDLLSPSSGYVLNAQVGGAPPGVSSAGFGRGLAQVAGWIPIDPKTQLLLKAEAGAVFASSSRDVPGPFLFRTGGDTTVRGYAYLSLGPREGDATVPGRYYAIGTAEIVHWFAPTWGLATFIDAGNAADSVRDLKPVYGYGVGARLRTPIGPFRFDVAYGEAAKTVRMHLSVGLSF
jgi:translocation and assembly module TamA